ncbi:hypothetical protein, partial [Planktothrix sp. FACHB-1355]|uniref:hypothetical protein n=1 Tax=Planktothrix sp. FACHB-1355 TaxID=2692854 RepID=UPI001A7F07E1
LLLRRNRRNACGFYVLNGNRYISKCSHNSLLLATINLQTAFPLAQTISKPAKSVQLLMGIEIISWCDVTDEELSAPPSLISKQKTSTKRGVFLQFSRC